ncbi:MAG: alpha/beta hydrolase domain-containing protein [candidate division Zixibacteria bacterium]
MTYSDYRDGDILRAGLILLLNIVLLFTPLIVSAKVVRLDISSREIIQNSEEQSMSGPYEMIKGIIYLEVDPNDPANELIVDLKLAQRNSRGNVEFSTEFELCKPVNSDRGNHRLLYFVNNRGNKMGKWHFNYHTDKNWLWANGWSYLWCGWNCDVEESDGKLNINLPVINDNGNTITGEIYTEIISYSDEVVYSMPLVWGGSISYAPVTLENTNAVLSKRRYRWEEPIEIPHDSWSFARWEDGNVTPDSGFLYVVDGIEPGWLYDLVYIGKNPKVTGLGLAAIRDVVSFFKYENISNDGVINPLADAIDYAYSWGHSQSGRLLNHFVYQDFNGDERKRIVFDGIMANCPGAGKGQFNSRFAQTTRHGSHHEDNLFPIDFFPFTTVEQYDPITGEKGDGVERARKSGFLPKIFFINSSTDYWTRAASMLHTDVEGQVDSKIDPSVRIYSVAGLAHTDDRIGIVSRALLTALDQWISYGVEPPASQIPKISNGTLVDFETWKGAFPDIPGAIMPPSFYHPYRLNMGPRWDTEGIADYVPPKVGPRYVCLVPQVDKDGNEIAGIRLPDIDAPLTTYTGWGMRSPTYSQTLGRNRGRVWPLPITSEECKEKIDPRIAILERYPTRADYLFEVTKSILNLKYQGLLLDEDVTRLLIEATQVEYWPCASQIGIKEVAATPAEVKSGSKLLLLVIFDERGNDILSVKAKLVEANNYFYVLNNDGKEGDDKAGDNI